MLCGEGLRLVVQGPPWASLKKLRNLKREHGDDSSVEALKDCSFCFSQSTVIVLKPQFPATGQVSVILQFAYGSTSFKLFIVIIAFYNFF